MANNHSCISKQNLRRAWTPISVYCSPYAMKRCKHEALVELSAASDPCLVDPHRLRRLIETLPEPDQQAPLMVACYGTTEKRIALSQLFPANDAKNRDRRPAMCKIYTDAISSHDTNPILFIDIDPNYGPPLQDTNAHCHQFQAHKIRQRPNKVNINHLLMNCLLLPFTDVVCVFADDIGGIPGVKQHLQSWADTGIEAAPLQHQVRVLIVILGSSPETVESHITGFWEEIKESSLNHTFPKISFEVFSIEGPENARYIPLRDPLLRRELDAARIERQDRMHLFSGVHLASLFSQCLAHISTNLRQPFHFLGASRQGIPIPPYFADCVTAFLRASHRHDMPYQTVASLLASSLLMQACPPSAHVFPPKETFDALFQSVLTKCFEQYLGHDSTASLTTAHRILRGQMLAYVSREFINHWTGMHQAGGSTAELHRSRLENKSVREHWGSLHQNTFCAICLLRRPEHVMKCRHSVCDFCVQIFATPRVTEEYTYTFSSCICCGRPADLLVRLKPPSAGLRILSIDGGGVRGIVPLEFLNLLQKSLGSSCRVQDLFDLALGTSVGGLEILFLFAKGWDVPTALDTFHRLAGRCFMASVRGKLSSINRFGSYIRCIFRDSLYKADALEEILKECFGNHLRMFDYPETAISQCKVAVTTMTTSTASTKLLTSYNGALLDKFKRGYRAVRPQDPSLEPLVWQAGRATSAAPGLFPPLNIPGLGNFQDGALRHNNPINIALWEGDRIWSKETTRDVVLSLGTGAGPSPTTPRTASLGPQQTFSSKFIPRLCRSFLTGLDGEVTWRELLHHLQRDAQDRFFRLNVNLKDDEPRLDDVKAIERLSQAVDTCKGDPKIIDIKMALLASCFFFELKRAPTFDASGFYVCQGEIRTRMDHTKVFMALRQMSTSPIEFFKDHISLGQSDPSSDVCPGCYRFRKKICFFVRHPAETISITINMGDHQRSLSGFPQSMAWFKSAQNLTSPFYDVYNVSLPANLCECFKADKLASSPSIAQRAGKRARWSGTEGDTKRRMPRFLSLPNPI